MFLCVCVFVCFFFLLFKCLDPFSTASLVRKIHKRANEAFSSSERNCVLHDRAVGSLSLQSDVASLVIVDNDVAVQLNWRDFSLCHL